MSLKDALNESLRSGLLFGVHEEPLDAYGKRLVRVIVDAIEREPAALPEERAPAEPKAWMNEYGLISSFRGANYCIPLYERDVDGKLTKPAMVGNTRFGVGIKWSTVIGRAEREYEYQVTPEKEAERMKRVAEFVSAVSPQKGPSGG